MGKIRVHKLATELGISNKELISELVSLGYPVKNHMSAVDMDEVFKIRETILAKAKEDKIKESEKKDIKTKPSVQISQKDIIEPTPQRTEAVDTKPKEKREETAEAVDVVEVYENSTLK
ncbi:MAG: translation initiation factor IF-2 N-terminal domain-containing protein, partial [Nitrospinota bacterium]|nr:translation initiation factor IF-2 N-terminal domain-containing protein [Nitrospinota bacterium]